MNNFDWINSHYGLKAKKGDRVKYTGGKDAKFGTITGADGQYLKIKLDGEKTASNYHPTWELEILKNAALA